MIRTFLIIAILLAGCGFTTTIKDPDGRQYEITSRSDAMVHAKFVNGVDLTVDNRGNPGFVEKIMQFWMLRWLDTDEGDK